MFLKNIQKKHKPVTKLETINGSMHILSILISISPGNDINMIVSSFKLADLRDSPRANPTTTPRNVNTNKICVFNCFKSLLKLKFKIYIKINN